MKLATSVSIAALLSQSASSFQPTTVPRSTLKLHSLIDQAYDVPSISNTYSRAGSEVAEIVAAKAPKVAEVAKASAGVAPVVSNSQSTIETSAKVAQASAKVAEASTKIAADATAQISSAVDEFAKSSKVTEVSTKIATDASAQVSSAVDEFVKAANDIAPAAKATLSETASAFKPLVSPLSQYHFPRVEANLDTLQPGKVRPLIGYIQEALLQNGGFSAGDYGTSLEEAKSKVDLLISNTYALFGKEAPASFQGMSNLPEGSAGWIAAGAISLIALGQRNAGLAEAKEAMGTMVQKEASAVSEIADELKIMSKEIERLNKETALLSKELQAAKAKLTGKDLALGQERLAAADKELQLNRVINALKTKLEEADVRLADLDEAESIVSESPASTPAEPTPLVRSVTDSAPIIDVVKDMELKNSKKKAAAKKKTATKGEPKTVRVVKSVKGEKKTDAKKKSVKGATTAKTSKPPAKKAATKKKAAAKKAKIAKKSESASWSTLSQSTLTRKTVKQLTDYLSTKGVATTDEDGKTLKKALLVEAVQAA